MPKGEKVGDAYIEVHADLDEKSVAKSREKLAASVTKSEKDLQYKLVRNNQELVQKAHIAALRENAVFNKKQEKQFLESAKRAHESRLKLDKKYSKRFKDGGPASLGEGVENVLSVLPGQLEKLFRSPAMASAGGVLGLVLAQGAVQTIAAGLAAGVAGGVIIGAFAAQIKKDPQIAALGQQLGKTFVDGFTEATNPLKENIGHSLETLTDTADNLFSNLNFTNLGTAIDDVTAGIAGFIQTAAPGLQDLVDAGSLFLSTFGKKLPEVGEALSYIGRVIKDNQGNINGFVEWLGDAVAAALRLVGALIEVSSKIQGVINVVTRPGSTISAAKTGFLADVAGLLDKLPGVKIDNTGLRKVQKDLEGVGEGYNKAVTTGTTYVETSAAIRNSLVGQTQAWNDNLAAIKNHDAALRTGLDAQITYEEGIDNITKSLKDNGRTFDITTEKGRANFSATKSALTDLKSAYVDQVNAGKISGEEAQKRFAAQSQAILKTASATGTAKKALQDLRTELLTFPKGVNPSVNLDGFANARANIKTLRDDLAGLNGTAATIRANAIANKNRATGGVVTGPGTGTSDSIPTNLSNGEFVIKASSAKKIGMSNLNAMNSSGKIPQGFATGGVVGQGRGKTASQVRQFNILSAQIAALNKTIATQTKTLEKFTSAQQEAIQQFTGFVNLAQSAEGANTAGDVLGQFRQRAAKAADFKKQLGGLKAKGLSTAALQQILEAGPESDLAKLLNGPQGLQAVDIAEVNRLLGGAGAYGTGVAETLFPGGTAAGKNLAKNKAALAAKQKAAAKLKPPKAKGATISYAGGKVSALFSQKELAEQQLKQGTYVTVIIDGKEVRAIVKAEANKQTAKANRNLRAGRR